MRTIGHFPKFGPFLFKSRSISDKTSLISIFNPEGNQGSLFDALAGAVMMRTYSKDESIVAQGDAADQVYLIRSGLVRVYEIDRTGKEHIMMFASEGWCFADFHSIEGRSRSTYSIQALERTEIESLHKSYLDGLPITPATHRFLMESMGERSAFLQRRISLLLHHSAKARYLEFLELHPELSKRLTQKMIAAYLGLTPEGLSRIRSQVKNGY